jgi:hypothetical protein
LLHCRRRRLPPPLAAAQSRTYSAARVSTLRLIFKKSARGVGCRPHWHVSCHIPFGALCSRPPALPCAPPEKWVPFFIASRNPIFALPFQRQTPRKHR